MCYQPTSSATLYVVRVCDGRKFCETVPLNDNLFLQICFGANIGNTCFFCYFFAHKILNNEVAYKVCVVFGFAHPLLHISRW
jgi:hypothetical protein